MVASSITVNKTRWLTVSPVFEVEYGTGSENDETMCNYRIIYSIIFVSQCLKHVSTLARSAVLPRDLEPLGFLVVVRLVIWLK